MSSTPQPSFKLPAGVHVLERGWLSSNQVIILGNDENALVDSGYVSHAHQTLALVRAQLGGRTLHRLVNTHLHSDHCGGNGLLQHTYPQMRTTIAPGEASFVMPWQAERLSHEATGQSCARFTFDDVMTEGQPLQLGDHRFVPIAAPGHDPHAMMLWCEDESLLISADALWEQGFGIVFPELTGESGFDDLRGTLQVIEKLQPRVVIPGHGRAFANVAQALAVAYARIDAFQKNPGSHHRHAIKALLKFLLLDWQQCDWARLRDWVSSADLIRSAMAFGIDQGYAPEYANTPVEWLCTTSAQQWLATALLQLAQQGLVRIEGDTIYNT